MSSPVPQPFDWTTFVIRFGLGFVIGGFALAWWFEDAFWTVFIIAGVICGLSAWRYGDRFWEFFIRWLR